MFELFYFFKSGLWHNSKYLKGYLKSSWMLFVLFAAILFCVWYVQHAMPPIQAQNVIRFQELLWFILFIGVIAILMCAQVRVTCWEHKGVLYRYFFYVIKDDFLHDHTTGFLVIVHRDEGIIACKEVVDYQRRYFEDKEILLTRNAAGCYRYYSEDFPYGYVLGSRCFGSEPLFIGNQVINALTGDSFFPVRAEGEIVCLYSPVKIHVGKSRIFVTDCETQEDVALGDLPELYANGDKILYFAVQQRSREWKILQAVVDSYQGTVLRVLDIRGLERVVAPLNEQDPQGEALVFEWNVGLGGYAVKE